MRIARFISGGATFTGTLVDGDGRMARVMPDGLLDGAIGEPVRVERLLAPLAPTDILCIGLNYREHAAESGSRVPENPLLFIKSSGTLNDPGGAIQIPRLSSQIDFEGELAVVIGRDARHVPRERALDFVFGYTIANDVTARDWQRDKALGGGQFARGKSFDGFCPLGPWIVTRDELPDPSALWLRTLLNGQVMQEAAIADMIFDVPRLIESLSSTMTLRAGAIVLTGTPPGVGFARNPPIWLKPGDTIAVEIGGIGRLENPIVAERAG